MGYSALVSKAFATSPNHSSRGGLKVCKFTPHHMAGNLSIETCSSVFASASRQASSNYGIGTDGRLGGYVPEELRAWTSASKYNDQRAITVEVANASGAPGWTISQAAWETLVKLGADVCDRYGFRLDYTGDKYGSLTEHQMFVSTSCPGTYIHNHILDLERQVNAILDGKQNGPTVPAGGGVIISDYDSKLGYLAWFGGKFASELQRQMGTEVDGEIWGQAASNKKYFWAVDGGVRYGNQDGSPCIKKLQGKLINAGYSCGKSGKDGHYGTASIKATQRALEDAGYDIGSSGIDGLFGHDTSTAFGCALLDGFFKNL